MTILYTAPTAIRTFMKWGDDIPAKFDLSLAAAARLGRRADQPRGVALVPQAHRRRPRPDRRHVVADRDRRHHDQPAARRHRRSSPARPSAPIPGISAEILDDEGKPCTTPEAVGYLVLTKPWPAMLRGIWGDPERYKETYWSRFGPKYYFAGDGAKYDADGNIWLLGRVDDVMNVSGHRLSTAEIESALVSHPKVAEAAVVGATDETTGQAVVRVRHPARQLSRTTADDTVQELRNHVAKEIGPIAKPRSIMVVAELPKTRSGKIMRRLLARRRREPRGRRRHDPGRHLGHGPHQGGHGLRQGGLTPANGSCSTKRGLGPAVCRATAVLQPHTKRAGWLGAPELRSPARPPFRGSPALALLGREGG